jgi:hypothetical protein
MDTGAEHGIQLVNRNPDRTEREAGLQIFVVSTSTESTKAALRKAGVLADKLRARVLVLLARIFPYPLALLRSPVELSFDEERIRRVAAGCPLQTRVLICLCRDEWDSLSMALTPNSIVVLGQRRRWWRTRESKLAQRLRHAGHHVILAEEE